MLLLIYRNGDKIFIKRLDIYVTIFWERALHV